MIKFFKNYKVSILIMTIFLSLYWLYSILTITREATPSVNIPNYIVSVVYPWADPETINDQVVSKLEQKFKWISLVKSVDSTSANNMWIIVLEFSEKKSDVDATTDIKSAIDQVYSTMPSDVKYPTAKKVDVDDQAIYSVAAAGNYPTEILYTKLKQLEDDIKTIQWVSDVIVSWKPYQQIKVNFDFNKVAQLDLDIWNITTQLKSFFIKYPADKKELNWNLYSFEFSNYQKDLEEIVENLSNYDIVNKDSKNIKIKDIAKVQLSYEALKSKSFIIKDLKNQDTASAISLSVKKMPWADVFNITNKIKDKIKEFEKDNKDISFVETISMQEEIQEIYDLFFENFFETWFLVFIIILFFLWFKSSIIISLWFFIVYFINFIYFKSIDYSFNNVISFSLILVLGIMVDNLIVLTQWIVAWLVEHKNDTWKAINFSLKNYWKAIIFWTLSTVAIFLPLYLWLTWIMGEFLKYLPITIISNLLISLLVTIIILPILFIYLFGSNPKFKINMNLHFLERLWVKFADFYYKINTKKIWSISVVLLFWGLFIVSIYMVAVWIVKVDFFGNQDSNNVWINVKYEAWISLEKNQQYTSEISKDILVYLDEKYNGVIRSVTIDLASDKSSNSLSSALQWWWWTYNISSYTIRLLDDKKRSIDVKSYEIVEDLNNTVLKELKNKHKYIEDIYSLTQKSWPWWGKAVGFYIVWDDYKKIDNYISEIMSDIENIPGIYNITTSIEYTNGKVKYVLDDNKVKQYWVSINSVIMTLIWLKNSEYEPSWISLKEFNEFGDDTIDATAFIDFSWSLDDLKIWNIYLNQILKEKKVEPELLSIEKTDGNLAIKIEADKKDGYALTEITDQISKVLENHKMQDWLRYKESWDIESQKTSSQELWMSIIIWIALMFLVLIIQFNNVKYAAVIITSILLTISWAFYILRIFGLTFNFVAQLWIFWVFWVWVNQALIHIEDFKEFYEKDRMSVRDSFRKSIALRFIPIFLTKAVTIIGLIILAFKDEFFKALAISFIWGLIVSFFVTLFYIPSLMNLISKKYFYKEDNEKDKLLQKQSDSNEDNTNDENQEVKTIHDEVKE